MAKLKDTSITGNLTATGSIKSNTAGASLTTIGTVKLSNSLTSTSDTEAATSSAVKQVKDLVDKKESAFSKNSAFNRNYETNAANFKAAGTAAPGTLDTTARADHIHPPQTSISGNAGSASKLATARNIALQGDVTGSSNFDGTANISIATTIVDDSHNHSILESKTSGTILKDHGNGNVTISAAKETSGTIGDLYLGYNTSGHFTKNVRLESPMNWKGSTSYLIDSNGKIDWSNLKNIPSAINLGAVPITGGTMTGALITPAITINGSGKESSLGNGASDVYFRNVKSNKYLQLRDDGQLAYDGKLIYHEGKKPTASEIAALGLSGGSMTGTINSSVSSSTYINGNKGNAIINSTASGSGFNMLASIASTNGRWMFGSYGSNFQFFYTSKSTIDAGTNSATKTLTLLNEGGDSFFPGVISGTELKTSTTGATPIIARRTGNSSNINIAFDGNGTIRYLGCPNGVLKFGTVEDLNSNGSIVYHSGNKPSPSDIGAAAISGGKKIFCQSGAPTATATGDIWLKF